MVQVHPAGRALTLPAVGTNSAASESPVEVFASVFESARSAARASGESTAPAERRSRAPKAKALCAKDRASGEVRAEAAAERSKALKQRRTESAHQPTRADRMREAAAGRGPAATDAPAATDDAAAETPQEVEPVADASDTPAQTAATGERMPEPAASTAAKPAEPLVAFAAAAFVPTPAETANVPVAGLPQQQATAPGASAVQAVPEGGDAPSAEVTKQNTPGVVSSPVAAHPEASVKAGEEAAAKPAEGHGRAVQFQNILQGQAGHRSQAAARPVSVAGHASPGVNIGEPKAAGELAQVIRAAIGTGRSNMMLRLDPPELGQLQVNVRMQDGILAVRFEAQTAAGQEALQSKLGELRSVLEQQGFAVQQMEVELRPPSPQQSAPDGWQQQSRHGGHAFGDAPGRQAHGQESWAQQGSGRQAGDWPVAAGEERGEPAIRPETTRRLDLVA